MKFVVIGGDAAGMSAAARVRRNCPETEVIVLEKTMDVSYSACGMPYNIADSNRDIEDLVVRPAKEFRETHGIDLRTGHQVEKIDPVEKIVRGATLAGKPFAAAYDKLLIATGASPIVPDITGFDLPGVMVLKSLEHGRKIKMYLRENNVRNVVIIGMGYIALEMAEALKALELEVDLVKSRSGLLPWLSEELTGVVKKELLERGVRLYPGYPIRRIESSAGRLNVICNHLPLDADMVLVAIGVTPNSFLAADAGLKLSVEKSIEVDSELKTSDPDIYAAGDCADAFDVVTGKRTWIPLALRANRAGWAVADNVCGKHVSLHGVAGTGVFKVFGLEVARTGLNFSQAEKAGFDPAQVTIKTQSRAYAHPGSSDLWVHMVGDKASGRLLGVQMVGREGVAARINAPAVALHGKMTVEHFSQSDLAYAPPFGPVWDPMLTAAHQLLKRM